MMYESAKAFGADHPRLLKRLEAVWNGAVESIQSIVYNKKDGSMIVEAESRNHMNQLHTNRPKVRGGITLHYRNTDVEKALERRKAYNLAVSNGATDKSSTEISGVGGGSNRYFRRSVAQEAIEQAQKGDPYNLVRGLIKAFNR